MPGSASTRPLSHVAFPTVEMPSFHPGEYALVGIDEVHMDGSINEAASLELVQVFVAVFLRVVLYVLEA